MMAVNDVSCLCNHDSLAIIRHVISCSMNQCFRREITTFIYTKRPLLSAFSSGKTTQKEVTNQARVMTLWSMAVIMIATCGTGDAASNPTRRVTFAMDSALPTKESGQLSSHPDPLTVIAQRMTTDELFLEIAVLQFLAGNLDLESEHIDPYTRRKVLLESNRGQRPEEWPGHIQTELDHRIEAVNKGPFGDKWLEFVPENARNFEYRFGNEMGSQAFVVNIAEQAKRFEKRSIKEVEMVFGTDNDVEFVYAISIRLRYQEESKGHRARLFLAWDPQFKVHRIGSFKIYNEEPIKRRRSEM